MHVYIEVERRFELRSIPPAAGQWTLARVNWRRYGTKVKHLEINATMLGHMSSACVKWTVRAANNAAASDPIAPLDDFLQRIGVNEENRRKKGGPVVGDVTVVIVGKASRLWVDSVFRTDPPVESPPLLPCRRRSGRNLRCGRRIGGVTAL